ncbi:Fet3 protein [Amylocystis lapponica]|nr:Fet3 protein [Amylocystis lapponica]
MRTALALLAAASSALALQESWWNISYVEGANPDGLFPRRVIGVNGTWPPPSMSIHGDDDLIVHAYNSLDVPATLHHHGMFFNSTSWFDGANKVGQCGIPPGQSLDYIIPLNATPQHGTYWVHSHYGTQYVDGLRSPFVLHPPSEAHSYDEEFTVILSDWYHDPADDLLGQFINIANPGGAEPVPDAGLIYFAQNSTYLGPIAGSSPDPVTGAVGFNENATLPFEPGKTYRLRIVNVGGFAGFYFWIDGHEMRIIEVDGTDVEEYTLDQLGITVAQRYSVLVTALNDTSANYAIHADMDTSMFDTVPPTLNPNVTSSITYNHSAPITDYGGADAFLDVDDTAIVPLVAVPVYPSTQTIALEFEFDTMDDGTNHATFNGTTYNPPLVPAIMSEMTLLQNATTQEAYGPLTFVVDHLEVFDIVIMNGDTGKHPFHLHGHTFQIVNRAQDYTSSDPALNPPINESQVNPIRRDTVLIPPGTSVALRVIADNPGAWFFHCHIEWHLEVGLAMQIIEAPLVAQQRNALPQEMYDHCAALGFPTAGNAAGLASTTDLDGLPSGPYVQNNGWHSKGIGAMAGCVLTATLGMITVVWYALGGHISEAEMEYEARLHQEEKERRGRFFGLAKAARRRFRA